MSAGLVLLGLFGSGISLQAQEPRLGMEVNTAVVSVGDRITLTLSVDHAPEARVAWPDSLDLAPFEVLGARAIAPTTQGETARSSLVLTLAAFELGELEIPSFDVEISGPAGESTTLATDRYGVQVVSVGLDEGGDIRDIKGPIGIPMNLGPPLLILVAIVLAGILARILYRRRRRWDPELRDTHPAAPWRAPHEVALEALQLLESSSLLEDGEVKEFHIQVSDILRTYIEGRFRIPALEMTTSDIMPGLGMTGMETGILEDFHRFLQQCDMVKFAKQRPDPDASRAILALGRRLVEDTIPTPAPADPESGVAQEPEPQEVGP